MLIIRVICLPVLTCRGRGSTGQRRKKGRRATNQGGGEVLLSLKLKVLGLQNCSKGVQNSRGARKFTRTKKSCLQLRWGDLVDFFREGERFRESALNVAGDFDEASARTSALNWLDERAR